MMVHIEPESPPGAEHLFLGEAFGDFFTRDYQAVAGLAAVLAGDWTVGEDLAQEAFAAAYRRWDRISAYDMPGAWVRRVVANKAASHARRRVREAVALVRLRSRRDPRPDDPTFSDDDFWAAVRALPARQAQCLALRYLEDRSVADIAQILGIADSTVRVHIHHGRRALAATLNETMEEDE